MNKADIEDMFDDLINDSTPDGGITVCGIFIPAAKCLKHCDPIAYRVYLSDFESGLGVEEDED